MDKIKKMNKSRDMRKSRRKSRKSRSSGKCSMYLNRKIGINISEFKVGRYKSQPQAVAVAYSQVRKEHPACKRMFPKIRKSGEPVLSVTITRRPPGFSNPETTLSIASGSHTCSIVIIIKIKS